MQAAYRCQRYAEAAATYAKVRAMSTTAITKVVLLHGLKIYGRLRDAEAVTAVWEEIIRRGWLDKFRAAARMDAAAEIGDIDGAASILELMRNDSVEMNELHYTSAINACKNSDHKRSHVAALFLLEDMFRSTVLPDTATFSSVVGAHKGAPIHKIELVLDSMAECRVEPNKMFVEECLAAIFNGQLTNVWTLEDVAHKLRTMSMEKLRVAPAVLENARNHGVRLTKLCSFADRYLERGS